MSNTPTGANSTPQPADADNARVRYPDNSVVAIIDTVDNLSAAHAALIEGGFLKSEIQVLCGADAAQALRDNTGRTGLSDLVMRIVTTLGMPDDETIVKGEYADALHAGQFVVVVLAPTEERKTLAARMIQQHGGKFINFLGEWMIEGLGRADAPSGDNHVSD